MLKAVAALCRSLRCAAVDMRSSEKLACRSNGALARLCFLNTVIVGLTTISATVGRACRILSLAASVLPLRSLARSNKLLAELS